MSILGSKVHQLFPIIPRAAIIRTISNPNIIQRNFTVSNTLSKKSLDNLDPESKVILLGNKDKRIEMKYSEVLGKVGQRKLVKVQMTKKAESDLPMFKIMSDVDLEIAARKARTESNYLGSRTIYETDSGRLKQKRLELKSKLSDNDLSYQTAKILKWLEKGQFVNITIKVARGDTKEDAAALKKKIEDGLSEHKDTLGVNNSNLVINVK